MSAMKRRLLVAAGGYAVVMVFAAAFGILYLVSISVHERPGWPELSVPVMLPMAGLVAAPLALALVWERLTKVKVFDVEISLTEVTAQVNVALPEIVIGKLGLDGDQDLQPLHPHRLQLGSSLTPEIVRQIKTGIENTEVTKLAEVNLGDGRSWWSTRLYLLAALAEDYTKIQQLVFVANRDGQERSFVGMATPASTRRALALHYPILETAYRQAYGQCAPPPDGPVIASVDEVAVVVQDFGLRLQGQLGRPEAELKHPGVTEWVTLPLLRQGLGLELYTQSVEWDGSPVTPLLCYRIIGLEAPFVALIENRQVKRVVDRLELGIRLAHTVLQRQLR